MSESNGKNGNGKKVEFLIRNYEKTFNTYMDNCANLSFESNEKSIFELIRRLDTELKIAHNDIDEENEKKIIYSLKDRGEIVYHKEVFDKETNKLEISISSYKKDLQDTFFYVINSFWPQTGRAFYYEDARVDVDLPKHFAINPDSLPQYAKEILAKYSLMPNFMGNIARIDFGLKETKLNINENNSKTDLNAKIVESK
jgi:hypothetical protein